MIRIYTNAYQHTPNEKQKGTPINSPHIMNRHEITARVHNKWYWKWATLQNSVGHSILFDYFMYGRHEHCLHTRLTSIPINLFQVPFSHKSMGNFKWKWDFFLFINDDWCSYIYRYSNQFLTTPTTKSLALQRHDAIWILIWWNITSFICVTCVCITLVNKCISRPIKWLKCIKIISI